MCTYEIDGGQTCCRRYSVIKRIGITEARAKLTELVDGVHLQGDVVILLKRGKPAAAMLPLSLYEQWQE